MQCLRSNSKYKWKWDQDWKIANKCICNHSRKELPFMSKRLCILVYDWSKIQKSPTVQFLCSESSQAPNTQSLVCPKYTKPNQYSSEKVDLQTSKCQNWKILEICNFLLDQPPQPTVTIIHIPTYCLIVFSMTIVNFES